MKLKKILATLLIAVMTATTLFGCGGMQPAKEDNSINSSTKPSSTNKTELNEDDESEEDATVNKDSVQESNKDNIKDDETNTNDKVENNTEKPTSSQTTNSTTTLQDGKWVNFDKMQFSINGNTYTLGESTLQDLIDDGVSFKDDSLTAAKKEIKPNYQSTGYKITLGEYWTAQVYVGNYNSDANVPANELPIVEVYFPNKSDQTQNIISFAFSTDLTEEQLLSQCGEPNEKKLNGLENEFGTNTYKYTKKSTKYYANSKFQFDFTKGKLSYFYMTYMP